MVFCHNYELCIYIEFSASLNRRTWCVYYTGGLSLRHVKHYNSSGGLSLRHVKHYNSSGGLSLRHVEHYNSSGGLSLRHVKHYNSSLCMSDQARSLILSIEEGNMRNVT